MTENYYEGVKQVKQLTPENIIRCEPCDYLPNNLEEAINHYLSIHDYKLLHVGTQSSVHSTGEVVHDIAAVLGMK